MVGRSAIRLASAVSVLLVAGVLALGWSRVSSGRASRAEPASEAAATPQATDAPPAAPDSPAASLLVRVLDAETGVALPACKIVVTSWERSGPVVMATDDAGKAEIEPLYGQVRVERRGYGPATAGVLPSTARLIIELRPAATVSGRVVRAAAGTAIEGASVDVTDVDAGETLVETLTDQEGRFEIPGVPPDAPFLVVVKHPGLAPAARVERRAQPERELVLELGGGAVIEGRVLRPDGLAAAGADVLVKPRAEEPLLWQDLPCWVPDYFAEAKADDQGAFRVEGLRTPAAYSVTATDEKLATGRVDDIELDAGGSAWRLIRLVARTTLVVEVAFPSGEPFANPSVQLLRRGDNLGAKGFNFATYELAEGGPYEVVVIASNWPVARLPIDIHEGAKNEVVVRMSRDGHQIVSGRVLAETGVPLGGNSYFVALKTPEGDIRTCPAMNGTFHLCDVPAPGGRLEVRDDQGTFLPWNRDGVEPGGPPVEVVLRAATRIVGRVDPVPRSRSIVLHREYWSLTFGGGTAITVGPLATDDDGRFTIPWAAGRPVFLGFETPDGAPLLFDEAPLAAGEVRDLGILRFGAGYTAEARILDETGNGIADAVILVDINKLCGDRHVRTDANGRFRLERLADTAITIEASAPGFVTKALDVRTPRDLHLQEITLTPAGFVEGTLLDAEGRPVAGQYVDCSAPDCEDEFWAETDSLGRFRIAAAPGKYQLRSGDDQGPTVEIRARETTRAGFRLKE